MSQHTKKESPSLFLKRGGFWYKPFLWFLLLGFFLDQQLPLTNFTDSDSTQQISFWGKVWYFTQSMVGVSSSSLYGIPVYQVVFSRIAVSLKLILLPLLLSLGISLLWSGFLIPLQQKNDKRISYILTLSLFVLQSFPYLGVLSLCIWIFVIYGKVDFPLFSDPKTLWIPMLSLLPHMVSYLSLSLSQRISALLQKPYALVLLAQNIHWRKVVLYYQKWIWLDFLDILIQYAYRLILGIFFLESALGVEGISQLLFQSISQRDIGVFLFIFALLNLWFYLHKLILKSMLRDQYV